MNDNELGNHSAIWCHGNIIHALKSEHYADNSYTNDVFMLVWPKFSIACAPSRPFSSLPLSLFQFVHRMYSTRITWRLSVPFALYFESSLLWNQPTKKKKKTKKKTWAIETRRIGDADENPAEHREIIWISHAIVLWQNVEVMYNVLLFFFFHLEKTSDLEKEMQRKKSKNPKTM